MWKWIINYQYGTYSGTETVFTREDEQDEDQAIAKMWKRLRPTLGMAYQSARVVSCEWVEE